MRDRARAACLFIVCFVYFLLLPVWWSKDEYLKCYGKELNL